MYCNISRLSVLLNTMEQGPMVVRGIVLTCILLNNILMTHLEGGAQPPNPQDELPAINVQLLGARSTSLRFYKCFKGKVWYRLKMKSMKPIHKRMLLKHFKHIIY